MPVSTSTSGTYYLHHSKQTNKPITTSSKPIRGSSTIAVSYSFCRPRPNLVPGHRQSSPAASKEQRCVQVFSSLHSVRISPQDPDDKPGLLEWSDKRREYEEARGGRASSGSWGLASSYSLLLSPDDKPGLLEWSVVNDATGTKVDPLECHQSADGHGVSYALAPGE